MKISVTYGFIMTLCSAFVSLALFFSGYHAEPDKLKIAQYIGMVAGIIISVACILIGMREKRANTPVEKPWGYGSALGTGVMIGLFGALFGAVYNYAYFAYIDPNFHEVIMQAQITALEARNLSSAQIERAEPMIRKMLSPVIMTVSGAIMTFIWNLVIALILAAFVKIRAASDPATQVAPPA